RYARLPWRCPRPPLVHGRRPYTSVGVPGPLAAPFRNQRAESEVIVIIFGGACVGTLSESDSAHLCELRPDCIHLLPNSFRLVANTRDELPAIAAHLTLRDGCAGLRAEDGRDNLFRQRIPTLNGLGLRVPSGRHLIEQRSLGHSIVECVEQFLHLGERRLRGSQSQAIATLRLCRPCRTTRTLRQVVRLTYLTRARVHDNAARTVEG